MDVRTIRLEIVAERERQGLNQRELAVKAGIDQGHLSKIENVDGEPMRDLAARIVFQIIERGLSRTLPSFFDQIDGPAQGLTSSADSPISDPSAPRPVPQPKAVADDEDASSLSAVPLPRIPLTYAQLESIIRALTTVAFKAYTREPEPDDQSTSGPRPGSTDPDSGGRGLRARARQRAQAKRRAGKQRPKGKR